MSDKVFSEFGKLIIDLLIGFERLNYSSGCDKVDNPNAIYLLYSSTLRLINRAICPEERDSRIFRLKYHHILSNDSVDEYLFHCLSKILTDLLETENNYQKFIQPVAELHMKLMSILTKVQLEHEKIVLANRRVLIEIQRRRDKPEINNEETKSEDSENNRLFVPIYFLPSFYSNKKLKKNQSLTFHAVHSHYSNNHSLNTEILGMLLDFDNAFAEFELEFVCQVNKNSIFTTHRAELTMNVAIMFSEAVQWAHSKALLKYRSISDCDIEIMVGIPRLAVVYGCIIATGGPLSEGSLNCLSDLEIEERLAPVFQDHRQELCRLRRQLNILNPTELNYLCQLLIDQSDLSSNNVDHVNEDCFSSCKGDSHDVSGDMHALFKLVSSVSDQMQTQHASDYRFFMEAVYKLYKDESDMVTPVSSSLDSQTISNSDLFITPYQPDSPCFTAVDEAVDALTYSLSEQMSPDSCFDLTFLSQLDSKALQSPIHVNPEYTSNQSSSIIYNSVQIIERNLQPRPQWRSDEFFPRCCHCDRNFNVFRRKHHCRRCGYLFCSSCWGSKLALPALGIQNKVPICIECEEFLNGKGQQYENSARSTS